MKLFYLVLIIALFVSYHAIAQASTHDITPCACTSLTQCSCEYDTKVKIHPDEPKTIKMSCSGSEMLFDAAYFDDESSSLTDNYTFVIMQCITLPICKVTFDNLDPTSNHSVRITKVTCHA